VIGLNELSGGGGVAVGFGQAGEFVIEYIRETFEENEREEVVLELRRIFLAADGTCCVPEHLLHGLIAEDGGALKTPTGLRRIQGLGIPLFDFSGVTVINARTELFSEFGDGLALRPLRSRFASFPPIDRGERYLKPDSKLLLTPTLILAYLSEKGGNIGRHTTCLL